jgi:hypothetical protein
MKTHWLQSPNKNYLGHWDLPDGKDLILTIASAKWEEVENPVLKKNDPKKFESHKVIRFEEDYKPLICNQINAQSIIKATGKKYMEDSIGERIQLYVGVHFDKVSKENVDCVRIRSTKIPEKTSVEMKSELYYKIQQGLNNGFTLDQVKQKYTLSKEVEDSLKPIKKTS